MERHEKFNIPPTELETMEAMKVWFKDDEILHIVNMFCKSRRLQRDRAKVGAALVKKYSQAEIAAFLEARNG